MADIARLSAGLELGSSKVALAVIQWEPGHWPQLIGFNQVACQALKNGIVIHLEGLQTAIRQTLEKIGPLAQHSVSEITVNIPAGSIEYSVLNPSLEFKKRTEIKNRHLDVLNMEALQGTREDWDTVQILPEEYRVDGQGGIEQPLGMAGNRIEAVLQSVSIPRTQLENILHSMQKCRLRPVMLVADPIADIEAMVTPDERELGVLLINIGAFYIQMAAVKGSRIEMIPALQIGSDQITSDIAIGLRTPRREAEKLKVQFGAAVSQLADPQIVIEIPSIGGSPAKKQINQNLLADIIRPRVDEMLEIASQTIRKSLKLDMISAGIVLTGGGAMLPGMPELAEKHFGMPVMQGHLREIAGMTDMTPESTASTAVGLALFGLRHKPTHSFRIQSTRSLRDIISSLFDWFGGR